MSEENPEQFWKLSDAFINLANELYQQDGDGRVGYAMMYAAARFNAFMVATTAGHKNTLEDEKEEATQYFTEQYRKMFSENIEDYRANFEQYL